METLPKNNLYLGLHRYAAHQDENFTTEAFVQLLRHLQIFEPNAAARVIVFLTNGLLPLTAHECSGLAITTQKTFMLGRPDILISSANHFVIVEVKVESKPGWDQLERYRAVLDDQNETHKYLILLSRYPASPAETDKVDCGIQWHRIIRLLENVRQQSTEPVTRYLILQFVEFFAERGIAMEKVGWELVRGVQSLLSLVDMLDEAVIATRLKNKPRTAGIEFNGRYFYVSGVECWTGIYYSKPQTVLVEAYGFAEPPAANLGSAHVERASKNTFKWINELALDSEEVHFFALAPDNQQAKLQEFISRSVIAIEQMNPAS